MSEVMIVDLNSLPKRRAKASAKYSQCINAALTMSAGSAVYVDVEGCKNLYGNVDQALMRRQLKDRLAVRMVKGKVYIIRREDK